MSIDAWAQVTIFTHIYFICGPGVVVMKIWDRLYLGRAPRTKETLLDFHEWCRVTRHPQLFRRLTGCQRTPVECNLLLFSCIFIVSKELNIIIFFSNINSLILFVFVDP